MLLDRGVASPDECLTPDEIRQFLSKHGYGDVWFEDTDQGLVIHGLSLGYNEGGEEILVPEDWMNQF